MGVHELKKDDLVKLGRWHSKKDDIDCPEYLVRSFKKKLMNRVKKSSIDQQKGQDEEQEITIKDEPIEVHEDDKLSSNQSRV